MFSIVIPLYNKESQIGYSIRSILSQTFQDFEIIVVNDGSTDNSVSVAESVMDSRIRIINQINAGVSAARNRGIKEARYDLIAFLDADDKWKPDYLDTQYRLTQQYPECSVFACNYEFQNSKGKVTPTIIRKLPFTTETGMLTNYFEVASMSHPPLCTSAVAVRKQAVEAVGGFPIGIKSGEDLLTWARLAVKFKIAYCTIPKAIFVNDQSLFNQDQKNRIPEMTDFIGEDLDKIYKENMTITGLKQYNALWHKMRARIFIDKGYRVKALNECFKSLKYHFTYKVCIFICMIFLPTHLVHYFFKTE